MSALKLGKNDPVYHPEDLRWADLRLPLKAAGLLPAIPPTFGHGETYSDWLMLGNGPSIPGEPAAPATYESPWEGCGDCVWAAAAHEVMESLTDAGQPPTQVAKLFDTAVVVGEYAKVTGYDPATGAGDNGTEVRARLAYMQETGILDTEGNLHKIGPFVELEPGNLQHLLEALYFFEGLPLGVQLDEAQMEAFNAAEQNGSTPVWTNVAGSKELGGHCIPMVGRPDGEHFAALTWARRVLLTPTFLEKQCDEAWAYVTPDRISKVTGSDFVGVDQAQLEAYLRLVAKAPSLRYI
ncbi:MAG TPA: hypothetical protein VG147_11385 [Solirubrobacteraceae bacterium]|jgi:hypothetical protein|nr:hypothetical protein [Solirubrobacteraceae bacterium]